MTPGERLFDTRVDTRKIFVTIKTKFVLRDYINAHGRSPLYIFISSPGSRKRVKTEVELCPKSWDQKKQKILPAEPDHYSLNLILENLVSKITKIKTIYLLAEKQLTATKVVEELKNSTPRVDFIVYYKYRMEFERPMMSDSYFKRVKKVYGKLQAFRKEILFSDIDANFVDEYRSHYSAKGNQQTTISGNVAMIKKFLGAARKEGIKFPLEISDIKVGNTRGNRIDLSPLEVKKMYNYYFSEFIPEEWKLIVGYFLFSCFTSIRWKQISELSRNDVVNRSFINYYVSKSKKRQSISLNQRALEVVDHCRDLFTVKLTNQYVNRELKKIIKQMGIQRKVTFHVARHTFGTNFIRMGGDVVKLRIIMGHSDIKTTMIYVHIVEQEAATDMALMDKLF